ncbi:MAG: T9SS type A sorting domain-containing protein [Bacteroidales bacterium]
MKTKVLLSFIIAIISFPLFSQNNQQEVISTGGNHFESEDLSVTFTVGETFVETLYSNEYILTQGFHQTKLTIVNIEDAPELYFNITAFPNPTNDFVNVKIEGHDASIDNKSKLHYSIFDMNGKLIVSNVINEKSFRINFSNLKPTTYFIKIFENNKEMKTFKIIKQ